MNENRTQASWQWCLRSVDFAGSHHPKARGTLVRAERRAAYWPKDSALSSTPSRVSGFFHGLCGARWGAVTGAHACCPASRTLARPFSPLRPPTPSNPPLKYVSTIDTTICLSIVFSDKLKPVPPKMGAPN